MRWDVEEVGLSGWRVIVEECVIGYFGVESFIFVFVKVIFFSIVNISF